MYIELPLSWKDNPFLMSKFKVHFDYQVKIIHELELEHVLYYPSKSDAEPLPPVDKSGQSGEAPASDSESESQASEAEIEEYRQKLEWEKAERIAQLKEYRSSLQKTEKAFGKSLKKVKQVMATMGSRPIDALEDATELVNSITDAILGADNLVLHLMNDDKGGDNLYYHAMNVTVLSLMVARSAGIPQEQGYTLGLGALFHDVGKIKVPKKILLKKEKLNKAEHGVLEMHAKYGVDLLTLTKVYPEEAMPIVYQHHEYLDGSGYPQKLKGDQINPLAQIVAVVNAYDNLCHPPNGQPGRTPSSALSFIFKNMKGKLNAQYVEMLVKLLGVYPPGSVVGLSDGSIGLVMSVNEKDLLHPHVLLYDPSVPRSEAPAINMADTDLKVMKVFKPTQLKQEALEYLSPRTQLSYNYYFEETK